MNMDIIQNCNLRFTIALKSHTRRKKALEAKRVLADIYPYEVEEDHLLIIKTDRKGFYDVFIAKEETNQSINRKKVLLSVMCVIGAVLLALFFLHKISLKNKEIQISQRERERHAQEEERVQKEKENKLEELKKKYDAGMESSYEKIYPCLERLYSVMTQNTTVENLSIEKNTFTVEVTTRDALNILSNFESSKAFSSIKMNRSTVKNGIESVAYNGEFSRYWDHANPTKSMDERIEFYSKNLDRMNEKWQLLQEKPLSEYIKDIRNVLRKNNCLEQYIQLRGKEKNAEVEFFILSSSRNLLNFINEIQKGDGNIMYIKSLRIRNSEDRNRIQTTIRFDSGIELKKEGERQIENAVIEAELSDMERIFYKKSAPKSTEIKTVKAVPKSLPMQKTSVRYVKTLSYLGITKSSGRTLVIAKDDDMGAIYKLVLVDEETRNDCCIVSEYGYKAKIRGEYYEVKK